MIRLQRLMRSAVLLLLVTLGLVFAARAHAEDANTLKAHVGPGASISLTDSAGNAVSHLDPGTYTIEVEDEATFHNFHLTGPGVDKATSVANTEKTTWTVNLTDGTYTFVCDAHVTTMRGTFTVGTPATTTTQNPPPAAKPTPLLATVGPGATITLKRPNGKVLKSTKRGRYRITVRDRASAHDFHLTGPGVNRRTGVPFVGTKVWTLTLKAGVYRFVCDAHAPFMKGSFRVTS